jgi:hypothetical protein
VGGGGRDDDLRLGGLRKPLVTAGRAMHDEAPRKLEIGWEHAPLALNPSAGNRKGRGDRETSELEAVLGKTHRTEF